MSNFPTSLDDDVSLPPVNDNIVEIGADAINAVRDAVFNVEQNIGIEAAGSTSSIAARLGISLDAAGNIKPSAITSLGLITLPITNLQIADSAQIPEYKLVLDHRTADLFNYIQDLNRSINTALGWISSSGIKLEPHLLGFIYRHTLDQIDVTANPVNYLKNKFSLLRDNTNAFTVLNDLNNEFIYHQLIDGSVVTNVQNVTTLDGSTYPSNYGHTASGIWLNTSRFATVPQTATDVQQFADFVDSSSIFLLGSRIQNLYSNGISRASRSSSLLADGYGPFLIPFTPAITYLLNTGSMSSPFDDINAGDDIIEFKPASADIFSNSFDAKFALVKVGDIATVNYGSVETQFLIKEKKYIQSGGNKKYVIRIAGKNLFYNPIANVGITKSLFNNHKEGVLALSASNNPVSGSLIVSNPRGAQTLGVGFNPDQLDNAHYLLYLVIYPNGNPTSGVVLPAIDVTGNAGITSGVYTLSSIVETTNNAFRKVGYNYRFVAFQYNGSFGIMLSDSYNNVGFSIVSGVVTSGGTYDQTGTVTTYPNNVLDLFPITGEVGNDALGIGPSAANMASPTYQTSYSSAEASQLPTKLFLPLKRNNFYINGVEIEKLNIDVGQLLDTFGDGFWSGTVLSQNIFPSPSGRVQTTYRIMLDLSTSGLKIGKTLVVQSLGGNGTLTDFGRFIIQNVIFTNACGLQAGYTDITVYDAVHGTGISPSATLPLNSTVSLYFSSDSISFNLESATDFNNVSPFKRFFEVYVNDSGNTFSHERGRINISGNTLLINSTIPLYTYTELAKIDLIKIAPKLRGYQFSSVTKITLNIVSLSNVTGIFSGYLAFYDGSSFSHQGPLTQGRIGQNVRFYDETNIDYIDVLFDVNISISNFSNQAIDIQLFPSLSQDGEIMLIGTCQYNDINDVINYLHDERQFGNTSEKDLTTSALDYISIPQKYLHSNGVIRGFDFITSTAGQMQLIGGVALVNGKFVQLNNGTVTIPTVQENFGTLYNINWAVCVNDKSEYQIIPLLDYDPITPTPNSPTRIVKLLNTISGNFYSVDANTFSDIINIRKDLTILYIVNAIVTAGSPPTISLTVTDARRYINDADLNLPLKLTTTQAQGNFRDLTSIFTWIKYNNLFNGIAIVKGADINSGVVNTPVTLDFPSEVIIDGQNFALLTFNELVTIGANVTLQNMTIIFNNGININVGANHVFFNNCTIFINVPSTPPVLNTVFNFSGGNLIQFNDCVMNIQYTSLYDTTQSDRGSVFRLTNVTNFSVTQSSFNVNYVLLAGVGTPGNMFNLVNSPGVLLDNCIFTGNFNQLINFNGISSFFKFERSVVTSTYNPNAGVTPDSYSNSGSFNPASLINSGQGYIYGNISGLLDGVFIHDVIFNYAPAVSNNNRYSFINFELSTNVSVFNNLSINNCEFNHLNLGGVIEDYRAAISIINTSAKVGTASNTPDPLLINANISNNTCNGNQAIVLSSITYPDFELGLPFMQYPGLQSSNCVIKNNTCGTIGYFVTSGCKFIGIPPFTTIANDKSNNLIIDGNTCHYIANLDGYLGQYFMISKINLQFTNSINQCYYPTGNVLINGNSCNWIHVGIAYEENSSIKITNNVFHAYDLSYLIAYNDTYPNCAFNPNFTVGVSPGYAIFVNSNHSDVNSDTSNPGDGNDSSCIVSGNTTESGYWLQLNTLPFTYKYPLGYIYTQASSIITNNILKGIDESSGAALLILLGGKNHIVTGNRIYRNETSIFAYIAYAKFEGPFVSGSPPTGVLQTGSESTGLVKNNFFDDYALNGPSANGTPGFQPVNVALSNVSAPAPLAAQARRWYISENINQLRRTTISLLESTSSTFVVGSPGSTGMADFIATNTTSGANQDSLDLRLTSSFPGSAQQYERRFILNNYMPSPTAKIWSIALNLFNRTANGITWNFGDVELILINATTGASATYNINTSPLTTFVGPAGSFYSVLISNQSNTFLSGPINYLDYPLDDVIIIDVLINMTAKLSGSAGSNDVLSIGPLTVSTIW